MLSFEGGFSFHMCRGQLKKKKNNLLRDENYSMKPKGFSIAPGILSMASSMYVSDGGNADAEICTLIV